MVKLLASLLISALLAGCGRAPDMRELDPLIQRIAPSSSADDERAASEALWEALDEHKVGIQIFVVQPGGGLEDALTANAPHAGQAFRVVLSQDGKTRAFDWTPKDSNNVFVLFREG